MTDKYEKVQGLQPNVDAKLLGARIEQLFKLTKSNFTMVMQWCQGMFVQIKKRDKVHIEWNEECLCVSDPMVTKEKLLRLKWNKHVQKAWEMELR